MTKSRYDKGVKSVEILAAAWGIPKYTPEEYIEILADFIRTHDWDRALLVFPLLKRAIARAKEADELGDAE